MTSCPAIPTIDAAALAAGLGPRFRGVEALSPTRLLVLALLHAASRQRVLGGIGGDRNLVLDLAASAALELAPLHAFETTLLRAAAERARAAEASFRLIAEAAVGDPVLQAAILDAGRPTPNLLALPIRWHQRAEERAGHAVEEPDFAPLVQELERLAAAEAA